MMTEPRKATRADVSLDVYALATVKAERIERAMADHECDDVTCMRPVRVLDADWPVCPMALLGCRTWRGIVDLYALAQVTPIEGMPDAWAPYVADGLVKLRLAVRREDAEREQRRGKRGGDGPVFSGRTSARGPA